jgi:hypothetical protein
LVLNLRNTLALLSAPVAILIAGCGGRVSAIGDAAASGLTIHAAVTHLDTNRKTRLTATTADGELAEVKWSISGGDPAAGAGSISADGVYTPPSFLTRDAVTVEVSAVLAATSATAVSDTAALTVTPGFLQPLTPGNLSLGPGGAVTISGSTTEVGGSGGIRFALASDASGTPSAEGTLSAPHCVRGSVEGSNPAYTVCSVTYAAPATLANSGAVYVLGRVAGTDLDSALSNSPNSSNISRSWTRVLLNASGIASNPVGHQARLAVPVPLGSSSGSNSDYDAARGQLTDCCGGTLGALLQDASGTQYVLSNNHVFARSDQSIPGETIIQPGLIDNGCTPYGFGPGTTPVATLTGYPTLTSPATNVDAAIARVSPGLVDAKGDILELGAKQQDGTLASAPPGVSSSGGKGEKAALGMMVAKSGRTTGLTCAGVSAVSVDVVVDYFTDCAETTHALSKTFTNQIAIAGTNFSDAGDSGALVVDSTNAEPVGLFFAGGTDANGVEHAIANPIGDVLAELDALVPAAGGPTSYSMVGGPDHPVSCLSYDGAKTPEASPSPAVTLSLAERERVEAALPQAQLLLNPSNGIVRIGVASSKDQPGTGAIAFYAEATANPQTVAAIPNSISGVATIVLPAVAASAESTANPIASQLNQPRAASLAQVLAVKQKISAIVLKANPSIFGIGVGQSLDSPGDAALVLFVDQKKFAASSAEIAQLSGGQRVRIIRMDRLHVTRSHGAPGTRTGSCSSLRPASLDIEDADPAPPAFLENHLRLPD